MKNKIILLSILFYQNITLSPYGPNLTTKYNFLFPTPIKPYNTLPSNFITNY